MQCQAYREQHGCDFISAMPTNLYGPEDNFDLTTSHVIPALIRKAHEAKLRGDSDLVIWGSGTQRREFLHVDDAADALVHLMTHYSDASHVNVGSGGDVTISELARLIAAVVGFSGQIVTDLPGLMEHHASSWTRASLKVLAGTQRSNSKKVSPVPIGGSQVASIRKPENLARSELDCREVHRR